MATRESLKKKGYSEDTKIADVIRVQEWVSTTHFVPGVRYAPNFYRGLS